MEEDNSEQPTVSSANVYDIFKTLPSFQAVKSKKGNRTPKRKNRSDERPRTPSGQEITTSVGDIRDLLGERSVGQPNKLLKVDELSASGRPFKPTQFTFVRRKSTGTIQFSKANHEQAIDHDHRNKTFEDVNKSSLEEIPYKQFLQFTHQLNMAENKDQRVDVTQPVEVPIAIMDVINSRIQGVKKQVNMIKEKVGDKSTGAEPKSTDPNPSVVDARAVVEMLESLKIDIEEKFQKMENSKCSHISCSDEVSQLNSKVNILEAKERMIIGTMSRMQDEICELKRQNENMDTQLAKKKCVLSGFEGSEKRGILMQQIQDFVAAEVGITIQLEDAYFIGQNMPRDIVITLPTINDKHTLFQNKNKLKNVVNAHGKKYVFRDFRPQKQNEINKKFIK